MRRMLMATYCMLYGVRISSEIKVAYFVMALTPNFGRFPLLFVHKSQEDRVVDCQLTRM